MKYHFILVFMVDRLEDRWTHEDTLKAFNPYREIFRTASAEVVMDVFRKHVKPQDRIIEIGSGLGELVALVPEYVGLVQQTEQSPQIVEGNRTLNPNSNVKVANVYDLPFQDGEFNLAVGLSVFDTLANLEDALTEVGRVLTPDGKFIHFLDILASVNTIFHRYESSDVVPFPLVEKDDKSEEWYVTGLQLVDKKDLPKVRAIVDPRLGNYFDDYVKYPEFIFTEQFADPKFRLNLRYDSERVRESGVSVQQLRFNDDFRNLLEENLSRSGYKIIESGKKEGIVEVRRNGRHREYPQFNVFHNDVGDSRNRFDPSLSKRLGTDNVKVISTLYVTVAQKAQPQ